MAGQVGQKAMLVVIVLGVGIGAMSVVKNNTHWILCTSDSQCHVTKGPCGAWDVGNTWFLDRKNAAVAAQDALIECSVRKTPEPSAVCSVGRCMLTTTE